VALPLHIDISPDQPSIYGLDLSGTVNLIELTPSTTYTATLYDDNKVVISSTQFTTQTPRPSGTLTYGNLTATSVDLQWTSSDATLDLYIYITPGPIQISSLGPYGTTTATGLIPNTSYYASLYDGDDNFLADTTFMTSPVPTGTLTVANITPTTATFTWTSQNATLPLYLSFQSVGGSSPSNITLNDANGTRTVTGFTPDTYYGAYLGHDTLLAQVGFRTPTGTGISFGLTWFFAP
jgi:hypothetical protein